MAEQQRDIGDHPIIQELERYGELRDRWPASKIEDVELFEGFDFYDDESYSKQKVEDKND